MRNLVLRIIILVAIVSIFLSIQKQGFENDSTSTGSPAPTITKYASTYDKKTRELVSPIIRDLRKQESYSFKIQIPNGWEIKRNEFTSESHTLVIEKDDYRFTISGPEIETSECNFAVGGNVNELLEKEKNEGEIGEIYDQYISLANKSMNLRLGRIYEMLHREDNFIDFNACELDKSYSVPTWFGVTKIGHMNFRTPYSYDKKIVGEIAGTISSIEITKHQ